MDYHKLVVPFLNTNEQLDEKLGNIWKHWEQKNKIDLESATKIFPEAIDLSPNIDRLGSYKPHCLLVSQKCGEISETIINNYDFLEGIINPLKLAFMGLIEDSFYLVGGNGTNNLNKKDSNYSHEILTYIQLSHIGYKDLADSMAMHFVSPQILEKEHKEGRFKEVDMPKSPNIVLDIITGVDALCTAEYLPSTKGSVMDALKYRIDDIVRRRGEGHPLVEAISNGGRERLVNTVQKLKNLMNKEYSNQEVKRLYGVNYHPPKRVLEGDFLAEES